MLMAPSLAPPVLFLHQSSFWLETSFLFCHWGQNKPEELPMKESYHSLPTAYFGWEKGGVRKERQKGRKKEEMRDERREE